MDKNKGKVIKEETKDTGKPMETDETKKVVPQSSEPKEKTEDKQEVTEEVAATETIKSADGRQLEYSVNGEFYKGKEITVPSEVAGEARVALERAGFFLKD